MAMGTFGAFTQARLAIYAAQTGITVTGNNISNINTPGYTRQRVNQVSLYAAGSDRYYAEGDIRTGQGALVKSISQIRNPYLDIRYREENAKVGFYDARLEGLNSIQRVLDEVGLGDAGKGEDGFGVLGLDIMNLYKTLQNITDQTGQQEYDDSIKGIATSLVSKMHAYAGRLEQVRTDTIKDFKQDIETVNNLLDSIRSLNEEIRKCEIHGDPALELRDSRNVKLDELSGLLDINVVYGEEQITAGLKVEKMMLYLGDGNPDKSVHTDESLLIDGVYSANIILGKPVLNPAYVTDKAALDKQLADGTITKDAYAEKLKDLPQYMKVADDGTKTPVSDIRDATILTDDADNPNYDMMITELKNKNGDLNYVTQSFAAEKHTGALPAGLTWKNNTAIQELPGDQVDGYAEGDKIIEIYTRTLKPGTTNNPPQDGDYVYTKQRHAQIISKPVALDDNDLYGELQAERELLTEEGVFTDQSTISDIDENAAKKRGIGYYQKALDLLANRLADTLNEANQGFLMDPDGNYIKLKTKDNTPDGEPVLDKDGREMGVPITKENNPDGNGTRLNKNWVRMDAGYRKEILDTVQVKNADGTDVTQESQLAAMGLTWKQVTDAYLKGQTWKMNDGKNGGKFVPENKEDIFDSNGVKVADGWGDGANKDAIFVGAPLFSNANNSNDVRDITASNIDISETWSHASSLVRSFTVIPGTVEVASGQSDNLLHMKYLVGEKEIDFIPNQLHTAPNGSTKVLFNGTFYQMWNDIDGTLGQDQSEASTMLDTYYQSALSIDTDRDSVSSVDFNDEAMNLMMYAKSYNAACRLMTTIDTVLDKLINNTGVTT